MARKKVREYDSKRILRAAAARVAGLELPIRVAQVRPGVEWAELATAHPWLLTERLVAKPDCLFGKRGKHDLVGLNLDFDGARAFVEARAGRRIEVAGVSGAIDVFVVEPFVPHAEEYYMCIQVRILVALIGRFSAFAQRCAPPCATHTRLLNSALNPSSQLRSKPTTHPPPTLQTKRDGAALSFSEAGGVDVEENWDAHVRTVHVPVEELTLSDARAAPLLATLAPERRPAVAAFLAAAYAAFLDCDFTLLEANPFTLDPKTGAAFPLDLRGELDDTAAFRSAKKWEGAEFPMPFGRDVSKAEAAVAALDESTGSSLKLTLLNPRGRIWTMVAGGGASVIYSDTVADLGFASELANYAEYSGGPSTAETYGFARKLFGAAKAAPDGRGRALIVGGGAAVMCSWGLFWL